MAERIRDAGAGDLEAIVAIYNATIPGRAATADLEPVGVAERADWLARHSPHRRPLWVAERDGRIAAWLSFDSYKDRAAYDVTAELSVYVDEAFRGRGLGRELLERALERAPGLGLTRLLGVIFAHNEGSVRLFRSLGFEEWGRLPGVTVLDGVERDVLILGRAIGPA